MANVLVVANETIGGRALLEAVRERAARGDARFFLVVPQSRPRHGAVIYDEAVRDAAEVRVELARQFMAAEGIDVVGDIGDPDPFAATMDAVDQYRADEVIVSTHPASRSGWLRRDLVDRIADASGLPVQHIVTDIREDGLTSRVTLVVANQTAESQQLISRLREKAEESEDPDLFIVVMPQSSGAGEAALEARRHLDHTLASMRSAGVLCAGMIGDPDPYTATMNALQAFHVDEVVVSTFAPARSAWLRGDLLERLRESTPIPVEHVMAGDRAEVAG
ncbi:MAG: hypothetical protein ACJ76S_03770 [Solirubrobacteraceae bacterium]